MCYSAGKCVTCLHSLCVCDPLHDCQGFRLSVGHRLQQLRPVGELYGVWEVAIEVNLVAADTQTDTHTYTDRCIRHTSSIS